LTRGPDRGYAGMLVLRSTGLFDGERFSRGPATVVVQDGTIVGVETGWPDRPADVDVLDLGDVTVLPGLVDTHVHLVGDSTWGALDRVAGYSPEELSHVVEESLRRQLAAGVTTVRDLGDRDWVAVEHRDRQRRNGGLVEPTVLASGPPLTSVRGHCHYMGGEVQGRDELAGAVQERADRAVDVVKVMASGGMTTPGTGVLRTQFTTEELAFLVDQAHRRGLPVTAHAHGLPAVEQALAVGVDGLEHCSCMTETGVRITDELLDTLATRGTPIGAALGSPPVEALARVPATMKVIMERAGLTPEGFRQLRLDSVRRMHEAGARFIGGRDAGISPFLAHGSMRESLTFFVEAGATAEQALAAATSLAADACGVGGRKGRLRPGYDADLLAVRGDLAGDVARLADVSAVVLAGVRVV
jgi:imidazolonepropionase-like amidohydrolase